MKLPNVVNVVYAARKYQRAIFATFQHGPSPELYIIWDCLADSETRGASDRLVEWLDTCRAKTKKDAPKTRLTLIIDNPIEFCKITGLVRTLSDSGDAVIDLRSMALPIVHILKDSLMERALAKRPWEHKCSERALSVAVAKQVKMTAAVFTMYGEFKKMFDAIPCQPKRKK